MTAPGRAVLQGIAASHGIAVGHATVLERTGARAPRRRVLPEEIGREIARLREAIDASRRDLERMRDQIGSEGHADLELLLEAHLLMHRDELLVDAAVRTIRDESAGAEWAVRRTVESLQSQLERAGSSYFRERAQDIEHVGRHILRALAGDHDRASIETPSVVVTDDLGPADAVQLLRSPILALVTALGSATSHTAILARALGVPAVVGVSDIVRRVDDGDLVIVDALRGEVVVGADDDERRGADARAERYRIFTSELRAKRDSSPLTRDGVAIELFANVDLPTEAALAVTEGARGIGLYRTEFLYLDRGEVPTEDEQLKVYSDVVRVMAPRPVVFRTFDLGADKLPPDQRVPRGPNPALGLRALRLALARPRMLRAQVRAILRAAVHGPVELLFPLVTSVDELREAKALVDQCCDELRTEGIPHRHVPIGIMVEVPAAGLMAESLARECDFFSVGTNDLVQYTLALDRGSPHVAHLAQALDPAVLKLLDVTARAAEARGIPLGMCGDMAADPFAFPLVLGLGYRRLSVPVSALPLVREMLRRIDAEQARRTVREALQCSGGRAVRRLVEERFAASLGDVWAELN